MGTKNNPQPNDCYHKAEPDEEIFVLLARDEAAPHAIRKWVNMRIMFGLDDPHSEKINEAMRCASKMEVWRNEHRPEESPKNLNESRRRTARERIMAVGAQSGEPLKSLFGVDVEDMEYGELRAVIDYLSGQVRSLLDEKKAKL